MVAVLDARDSHIRPSGSEKSMSEDSFSWYLSRIRRHDVPTAEEERNLLVRVSRGDEKAREELCIRNLRLVVMSASAFSKRHPMFSLTIHDLVQAGNEGLIEAIRRFDLKKYHVRLATYALWWIEMRIRETVAEEGRVVRYPVNVERDLGRYSRAVSSLEQENLRKPSIDEIALRLGITIKKALKLRVLAEKAVSSNIPVHSPDQSGGFPGLEDSFPDEGASPEEERYRSELRGILDEAMRVSLGPVSRAVFGEYFGTDDQLVSVARRHGMSDVVAQGRISRSKDMIRRYLESHGHPKESFFG